MPYPLSSQLTKDIDYFILDKNNNIFHFASAGTLLPEIVIQNYKENRKIHSSMLTTENLYEVEINPNLNEIIQFENDLMRELYLRDFIFYAQRGCYSYDKTYITDFNDPRYHLVASPIITKSSKNQEHKSLFEKLCINSVLDQTMTIDIRNLK
ncbi:hypothetical protein [Sulfurimonas microaerophilic]|uniref:hypothetical protein n=1 Tax=Sulfurimonas microaerophilic TaxID=3058392 RepID=UPI0027145EF9|nr:hypothetical protein [Sulfurimonas sp. hsl 1-7]